MVNKVILVGNLGKDPEVRHLESGAVVAKFSLATNETYKNKAGERVKNTEWHNVELWDGLAKVAEQFLKQGDTVYIEGKIKTEKYEKDGETRSVTKIRGTQMTMLGGKPASHNEGPPVAKQTQQKTQEIADDLPF